SLPFRHAVLTHARGELRANTPKRCSFSTLASTLHSPRTMKTKGPLLKRFSGTKRLSGILVGLLALSLVAVPAAIGAPFAYVANFGSASLSVIDTTSNTVVATVPLPGSPSGVAANSAGTRVYVILGDAVSVVNATTNMVLTSVTVGFAPFGVAVSPSGARVYV